MTEKAKPDLDAVFTSHLEQCLPQMGGQRNPAALFAKTVAEQVDRGSVNRASSCHREDPYRLPGWRTLVAGHRQLQRPDDCPRGGRHGSRCGQDHVAVEVERATKRVRASPVLSSRPKIVLVDLAFYRGFLDDGSKRFGTPSGGSPFESRLRSRLTAWAVGSIRFLTWLDANLRCANSPFLWPQIMLARSPGRPRPRKEWNAVHRGDRISRHSAYARSVPNGCCPTDSLLVVPADLRLW
jgi:hypothetical protein